MKTLRTDQFIDAIRDGVRSGYGLVPFVGSGLSSASGILMGVQFTEYLTWTVYYCVAGHGAGSERECWNLRKKGWPPLPKGAEVKAATDWVKQVFEGVCKTKFHLSIIYDQFGKTVSKILFDKERNDGLSPETLNTTIRRPLIPAIIKNHQLNPDPDEPVLEFWRLVGREQAFRHYQGTQADSPTSKSFLHEAAIRALCDWRASLDFLSRLHWAHDRPTVGDPDYSIIDSFNTHITRGRKPNLGHQMLCHLAGPARIRVVLTTNFDTLLEDAFEELHSPYKVIPVSTRGGLPHPDTVHALHCIVKMHGAYTETRADFSLDESPSAEDKRRFAHFVWGSTCEPGEPAFLPAHLLVCGYSAGDMRCVQMIKYYLDSCPDGQVFWICYGAGDVKTLERVFYEGDDYHARIHVTRETRVDLLFNALYQRLTLCLPEGGFSYQFFPNVPPRRIIPSTDLERFSIEGLSNAAVRLTKSYKAHRAEPKRENRLPFRYSAPTGVVTTLLEVFQAPWEVDARQAIWLELEDHLSPKHLAHELVQIMSLRLGAYQLSHHALAPLWRLANSTENVDFPAWLEYWAKHFQSQLRLWHQSADQWLIVCYGRNGHGGASGWEVEYWKQAEEYKNLVSLLVTLEDIGFHLIYAPYSPERHHRDGEKQQLVELAIHVMHHESTATTVQLQEGERRLLDEAAKKTLPKIGAVNGTTDHKPGSIPRICASYPLPEQANGSLNMNDQLHRGRFGTILSYLRSWLTPDDAGERKDRRMFLFAVTLMRQSRQYSSFFNEAVLRCETRYNAVGYDNDWQRQSRLSGYLDVLGNNGVFLQKSGQFYWMYRDVCLASRQILGNLGTFDKSNSDAGLRGYEWLGQARSRAHYWIADWFVRVYCATGHAVPFFEALFHYSQAALHAPYAEPATEPGSLTKSDRKYKIGLFKIALFRFIKTLRLGRPTLQFWSQEAETELLFDLKEGGGKTLIEKLASAANDLGLSDDGKAPYNLWTNLERLLESELRACHDISRDRPQFTSPVFQFGNDIITDPKIEEWDPSTETPELLDLERLKKPHEPGTISFLESLFSKLDTTVQWFGPFTKGPESMSWADQLWRMLSGIESETQASNVEWTRKAGDEWHRRQRETQYKLIEPDRDVPLNVVEFLSELVYTLIRRAKLSHHALDFHRETNRTGSWYDATMQSRPVDQSERSEAGVCWPLDVSDETMRTWLQICCLSRFVLDACAHVAPQHALQEARVRIRTLMHYGLALGRLGRFFEANRRFNEANALLSKVRGPQANLTLAEIKLRVAEVQLLEARHIRWIRETIRRNSSKQKSSSNPKDEFLKTERTPKNKNTDLWRGALKQWWEIYVMGGEAQPPNQEPLKVAPKEIDERLCRLHLARLDQAWVSLENAERLMSGRSQSRLLWSRLYALQLRVFDEHNYHPAESESEKTQPIKFFTLAFRNRYSMEQQVRDYFSKGVAAAPRDLYRYTRLLDYLIGAMKTALLVDQRGRECDREKLRTELREALASTVRETSQMRIWVHAEYCEAVGKQAPGHESADLLVQFIRNVDARYAKEFGRQSPTYRELFSRTQGRQ